MSHSGVVSRDVMIMCVVSCGLSPFNLTEGQLSADTFTPLTASLATGVPPKTYADTVVTLDQRAFTPAFLAREIIYALRP